MKRVFETVGATILVVALVVGLAVGGWSLYWFAFRSSENHTSNILRDSYEAQTTLRTELGRKVDDIDALAVQVADPSVTGAQHQALVAQRTNAIDQACEMYGRVAHPSDLTPSVQAFADQECK